MNTLRNQNYRTRDIRKLLSIKESELQWDSGIEANNEWVFASLEKPESKKKLLNWLNSKNIENSNQALMVDPSWSVTKEVTFGQLINKPECFFRASAFQIIDLDLKWRLDYIEQEVARFGRW